MLLLAGCSAPAANPSSRHWSWPEDPPTDRLGWEAGYWYNESIHVDQSDGLNASEREAFVARTMARVERIRGLEFERPVPVEVVTREKYRNNSSAFSFPHSAWDEQVWEALLLVGEDASVNRTFEQLYGGNVLGYYSPSKDSIVVVSDSGEAVIDRGTLAHELVHALQDQHFGFTGEPTLDARYAAQGLTEGDPSLVASMYQDRCEQGNWSCVPSPGARGSGGGRFNYGVYLTIYQPYSEGPAFVHSLYERGGWDAVNAAYRNRPASTEQVIHPRKYPDERPVEVTVPDRSAADWHPIDHDPQVQTVGEGALFAMFWANGYVTDEQLRSDDSPYSPFNYSYPKTDGWAGDAVVPYESDAGEYGYVFRTEWDTTADARQFAKAYRAMLQLRQGATRAEGPGETLVVADGPFADAFRVVRDGRTVTVVNAPTVEALDSVHRFD
ncbi:MAG: Hvo_1808 family surface protein [Haloferacaceae archaeon]